jgi:glycosyltransferase involved in cell wall biosynthesis
LILAGKGEMNVVLKEMGANLPVKPLIEYISEEDKLKYLNTSDIYIHSSIIELESLSCLEAIGCGLPCLIGDSPTSASSELFTLDNRFIFKMDDADDLADRIDQLYEMRHELPSLRKDVLAMAEKYRFATCMDQMEGMYHHVLRQYTSTSIRINTHTTNRSLQQGS